MNNKINDLIEKRAQLVQNATVILSAAEGAGRDLTEEEQKTFDSWMEQADAAKSEVEAEQRKQKLETANAELKASRGRRVDPAPYVITTRKEVSSNDVLRGWAMGGRNVSPDVYRCAESQGIDLRSHNLDLTLRTQTKGTTTAGGYTVDSSLSDKVIAHLKYYAPLRNYAQVISTAKGETLNYPTNDDTSNVATIVGEGSETTETDTVFGTVALGAYKYTTCLRLASELVEDSSFDLESWMVNLLAERIGRGQEADFEVGAGSAGPKGFVPCASSGVTSWTTTYANINSLYYAVDPIYRDKSVWMMNDVIWQAIDALEDDNGRPLLQNHGQSLTDASQLMLKGRPVVICNSMVTTGSLAKVIVFGDISQFIIRDVGGVTISRTDDLFRAFDIVAFYAKMRTDSDYVGPARALKYGALAS